MNVAKERRESRIKRQVRVRKKIRGTEGRPRLCVFRSSKHIYAQIIEDVTGSTLVSASTVAKEIGADLSHGGNVAAAKAVGKAIAEKALSRDIKQVVFDRNGFLYHGRVKALADAAREAGLSF
ncbi:MAG: 50S ribosomal protein L18 [Desulfuromonadales bacterium]|nr:50S ribosomal protein L18 [Desulfuromonadales bacterium]